jgi:hypothetical protein
MAVSSVRRSATRKPLEPSRERRAPPEAAPAARTCNTPWREGRVVSTCRLHHSQAFPFQTLVNDTALRAPVKSTR